MVDIEYIRKKYFIEGWSIRKIRRNLGVARQTVNDPFKDIIRQWLGGIPALFHST